MPSNQGDNQPRIETNPGTSDVLGLEVLYRAPAAEATELPTVHPHYAPNGHEQATADANHGASSLASTPPSRHNRPQTPAGAPREPDRAVPQHNDTATAWPEQPPLRTGNTQTTPSSRTERFRRLARRLLSRHPDTNAHFDGQNAEFYTHDPRTGDLRVHPLTPTAQPRNKLVETRYYPHTGLEDKIKTSRPSEKAPWIDAVETRRPEAELTDMLSQTYFADPEFATSGDRAAFAALQKEHPDVLARAYQKVDYMHPAIRKFDASSTHMQRYGVINHGKFPEVLAAISNELHETDPYGSAVHAVDDVIERSGVRAYIDKNSPFKHPFGVTPPTRTERLAAKAGEVDAQTRQAARKIDRAARFAAEDVSMSAARQAGAASRAVVTGTGPARRAAAESLRQIDDYLRGPDDNQRGDQYSNLNVDGDGYLLMPDKIADTYPYGQYQEYSPQSIRASAKEARAPKSGRHRAAPRRVGNHENSINRRGPGRQMAGIFHGPRQKPGRHRRQH